MEFSEVKGFVNKDLGPLYKNGENMDFFISPEKKCLYQSMDKQICSNKTATTKSIDKELKDLNLTDRR